MPVGIQLKRTKGWRLPPNARKVALPTIFGNPFLVTEGYPAEMAVKDFETWVETGRLPFGITCKDVEALGRRRTKLLARLPELRGHDLACFCRVGATCHRETLIKIANR